MKEKESYWQHSASHEINEALKENITVDVAIIGGGLAGVMCAYYLKDSGKKIAVFEANTIGCQTTGKTTGKITFLHSTIYQFLIKYYGKKKAQLYLDANKEALQEVKDIVMNEKIDCDFKINNSFVYTNNPKKVTVIDKEIAALRQLGIKPLVNQHNLPIELAVIKKSVGLNNQAVFHPLKYLFAITKKCLEANVMFYEHSMIKQYYKKGDLNILRCNGHKIYAKHLVIATRYPQNTFQGTYFLKLSQLREHVLSGSTNKAVVDSYLSIDEPIESFRKCNDQQLYASCDHRVGKFLNNGVKMINKGMNNFEFKGDVSFYGAQDTKAHRGIPYIGYLNKHQDNQYIICGFNKWGMTLSHVSAAIIRDLILNQENRYTKVFAVHNPNLMASKKEIAKLVKYSFKGMVIGRLAKITSDYHLVPKGRAKVMRINGILRGVYRDDDNQLHVIKPVCKHLRCILEFNYAEHTWDCPCHGSRYSLDGKLIEGPARKAVKKIIVHEKKES